MANFKVKKWNDSQQFSILSTCWTNLYTDVFEQFGLTTNIQNLKWYEEADHFSFFPRSYLLGSDDEKMNFIGL